MSHERQPYAFIPRTPARCGEFDLRETQKTEIYKQTYEDAGGFRFALNTPTAIGGAPGSSPVASSPMGPVGPGVGFEDAGFLFDSVSREGGSDLANGEIKWSIPNQNNGLDLKNTIQVHLSNFFFPKIYADTDHPEYFYYRRVYMEITNTPSSQAILGPNNTKYHFELFLNSIAGQAVLMIPTERSFFFQRPVTSLTEFNIRFYVQSHTSPSGFKRINIPADRVSVKAVPGTNPIRFQITSGDVTTRVVGPLGSQGTPGVAAFITGFASNSVPVNTAVNDTQGLYITNVVNSTTFEIGSVDGSTVDSSATYGATLFVPKNRITIPVRFTQVRDQLTNYIEVSHD